MKYLSIYYNDSEAGILTEIYPGKGYTFKYNDEYLNSNKPPISTTLPKREVVYESESLFPFFCNIIPEGANRRIICRAQKIDDNDFFGLLEAMAGRDFIGAVNIKTISNERN